MRKKDVVFSLHEDQIRYAHFKAKYHGDASTAYDFECTVDVVGAKKPHNTFDIDISLQQTTFPVTALPAAGRMSESTSGRITVDQLRILYQQLYQYAYEWMGIGRNLGFKDGELKNIQDNVPLLTHSPGSYFREMLSKWQQFAPGDGRGSTNYATLEGLKYALKQTNLGVVADELHL